MPTRLCGDAARTHQTDYNKWDKIVAALSDDEEDVAPAAAAPAAPPDPDANVGVGAALTGASRARLRGMRALAHAAVRAADGHPRAPGARVCRFTR